MAVNPKRVQTLFHIASEIDRDEDRQRMLEREFPNDDALLQRVEVLLVPHHAQARWASSLRFPCINKN